MKTSSGAMRVLLDDAIARDRTTARRTALLSILEHERYLTREQLIARGEGRLGCGCFGDAAWVDTFYRDMQVVKRALEAAGFELAYSRSRKQTGYHLRGQPPLSSELSATLEGSVAEINLAQIAILRQLSSAQRFRQGCSVSNLAIQVVAWRIRQRRPEISPEEAQHLAIQAGTLP